jgi:copper chaperone CopZ
MDCASCAEPVRQAIDALPGVHSVKVLFSAEKAIVQIYPARANAAAICAAIEAGEFTVRPPELEAPAAASARALDFTRGRS